MNALLRNFRRTDRLFRLFRHLPGSARSRLIDVYARLARRRTAARACPDRLTIFLTDRCNLRCAHCFIVKEVQARVAEMTLADYTALFASVRGRVAQLLLTGGEPTIRPDFVDVVVAASRDGRIPTVSVFSNGLRPDLLVRQLEEILARCDATLQFQTSIDGVREFHDRNRRVPGAYDRVLESIARVRALRERHPHRLGRVVTTTAISRQNLDSLDAICAAVSETGATPSFTFVRTSDDVSNLADARLKSDFVPEATKADGSTKFAADDYLDVAEMDGALRLLDDRVWGRDRGRLQFSYNRVTLQAVRDVKATGASALSAECAMGYDDLVILSDGSVGRCEMLVAPVHLGDHGFDLPRLLASPAWTHYLADTAGCWCTHECGIGISMLKEPRLLKTLT